MTDPARLHKLEALAARPGTPGEGAAAQAALERIKRRLDPQYHPLVGLHLRLDRSCDRRCRCCVGCGVIEPGKGPHRYALRCASCGRHRGWLSAIAASTLQAMKRDGRLAVLPILRDAGIVP